MVKKVYLVIDGLYINEDQSAVINQANSSPSSKPNLLNYESLVSLISNNNH